MRKQRLSRTSFNIAVICAFLLVVNFSLGLVLTRQSSTAMRSLIESRMLDVSNTAAALLDGDVLEKLQAGDIDTPEYQAIYRMLTRFEENIELEYIYCVREMEDGSFGFIIDPDPVAPGEFGEHIPYTEALYQAGQGIPGVDKEAYSDSWGRFYSAYSPVFDSRNEVGGIVAVDFSAEWYEQQVSQQVRTTLLITGLSLVFASAIIILLSARYRSRFESLFSEMNLVSEGIETLIHETTPGANLDVHQEEEPSPYKDEITLLSAKIHSLQNTLSEQISFVRAQAYVDGLTGLGNRTAYEDRVKQLDEQIKAGKAAFAIALFDINGLKNINDGYGHEQGDEAIVETGADLHRAFERGKLYRIGGDEFIAVLEGDETEMLTASLDRLAKESRVPMSRGSAVYDSAVDLDYQAVFNRADHKMYEDKRAYYLTHEDRRKG